MSHDFAREHLTLVLSFFPRVDSQISLLVGIEVAMVGYLASRLPSPSGWQGLTTLLIVVLVAAGASFVTSFIILYLASFPNLRGGKESMIYFRAIAGRTEGEFSEGYRRLDSDALLPDLSEQIWRNSQILIMKYDRLKCAFVCFAAASIAWAAALIMLPN